MTETTQKERDELREGIRALANQLEADANGARGTPTGIAKRECAAQLRALLNTDNYEQY